MVDTVPTTQEFMDVMQSFLPTTTSATSTNRKRVCFSPTVQASNPGPLAFEEVKDLWYNRTELITFKSRAKQVISESSETCPAESLRGLEHCTAERQKRKYMSIRCTISAARRGLGADHVASISQRCTAWNSQNAFLQGCHDYCSVYKPSMIHKIPEMTNTPPAFPFAMRKRVVTDASASTFTRRVRRRVTPPAL